MAAAGAHGVDGSLWGDYSRRPVSRFICWAERSLGSSSAASGRCQRPFGWCRNASPRALAIFNGGNALAAPLAATGATVGWRGAFYVLSRWRCWPSSGNALACRRKVRAHHSGRDRCCVCSVFLRYPGLLACGLFFMGQFTLFTYVRPFLETVTRSQSFWSAPDITGDWYRRFCRHAAYYDRSECPILSDADSYPFGHGRDCRNASAGRTAHGIGHVLLSLWGLLATAAPTGWWTWIARTLPEDAETGGGLMVAVIQLSIAPGQR